MRRAQWMYTLPLRLRSIFRRSQVERDLDDELQFHMEQRIAQEIAAGRTTEDAREAARRAMDGLDQRKEECRDMRRVNYIDDLFRDLRYAAHSLRRSPLFAVLAVLIMALGIGANTAVFSVVNGVLLKPLRYPGADRIVTLSTRKVTTGDLSPLVTISNFRDWRDQSNSFEAMATYRGGESPVSPGDTAEYGRRTSVDAQFFRVFGVAPILGRTFSPEEATPVNEQTAALISHGYWQTRFGGDAGVLQRTIRVGNTTVAIVGVMPPSFQFPNHTDIWTPQPKRAPTRTSHNLFSVGRLKPEVGLPQAQSELNTIGARLEQQYPEANKGRGVAAMRLQDALVGDVRFTLYMLWSVVGVVLLIACANTATLLLGKASARTREIAVRTALGASRSRIIRQLISESLLLALVAGALGIGLAAWGAQLLVALTPADVVRHTESGIDGMVLAFTLVVSIATSVLFGLVPAMHASRIELTDAIKQGMRSAMGGRTTRTRGILVASEIALSVVLLTGAGLLVKSLIALNNVELGFQRENALVAKATVIRPKAEADAVFRNIMTRIADLPGVVAVGATSTPPGDLSMAGSGAHYVDRVPEERGGPNDMHTLHTMIAPGTFAALGIPLQSGREFDAGDTAERPLVAIVNAALVRKSFAAGENPIGRTIFCTFDRKDGMTIVGVVGDVRQRNPAVAPGPECYMPYTQHSYNSSSLNIVVRTVADPAALAGTVRRVAADIAPDVPMGFTTMQATVTDGTKNPRFRTVLFGLFAVLAVCLAMAGVYGVIAYSVTQRSSEIGLRMALGASRGSVLWMILRQGLLLAVIGLAIGLAAAAGATRLLTTMLFEVRPNDVWVYLSVAVLLGLVTLVASYVPARRASRIDPLAALRQE